MGSWLIYAKKYIFIGAGATLLDAVCYSILVKCDMQIALAKLIGVLIGLLFGYYMNSRVTFQTPTTRKNFFKYVVLYGGSICVNVNVNSIVAEHFPLEYAFLAATGISVIINFLGLRLWVFDKKAGI